MVWLLRSPVLAAVCLLGPATADSWNPLLAGLWWGNIPFLMVAATVAMLRYPASGAFLLLTKVTPGVVTAWFAFRREWRSLAIVVGTTIAIAAVSFVIVALFMREVSRAQT